MDDSTMPRFVGEPAEAGAEHTAMRAAVHAVDAMRAFVRGEQDCPECEQGWGNRRRPLSWRVAHAELEGDAGRMAAKLERGWAS